MSDDLMERLEDQAFLSKLSRNALFKEVKVEIDHLQETKRRALDTADERTKEANELRAVLRTILAADDDFRASMPNSWEGDPLNDACNEARKILNHQLINRRIDE